MTAVISQLGDIINAVKAVIAGIPVSESSGDDPSDHLFKNVYEKGDVRDRTEHPYAIVHFGKEEVVAHPSDCDQVMLPLIVEFEFARPDHSSPGSLHRTLLRRIQAALYANRYLGGLSPGGLTYEGDGSFFEPLDQDDQQSFRFASMARFHIPYGFVADDPREPA